MIAIGIDIGGTSIKGAAITSEGKVMDVFSLEVRKEYTQDIVINLLIQAVNEYIEKHHFKKEELVGIGIGIPGSIDSPRGVVSYSNNLRWRELQIVKMMEEGTGLPVRITNDANAATFGEAKFGAGKDYKNVIMLTLGTGVGGGIVVDGKLYEGNEGKGAEMGHSVLVLDGLKCTCGRNGCLEQYASATALIRETKAAMEKDRSSLMWEESEKLGKIDGRVAFNAERRGDKTAHEVVEYYIKCLSEGILNYANIFRPEAVILSGGIANEGDYLTNRLTEYCKKQHYGYEGTPAVEIIVAKLGYDSGKIGAAALFF